jgi:hypothetical protein
MAVRERQEIRIVARGGDLAIFREGLKVGQILRGRVLAIFPGGKIIINLRGYNMMAETRGLKIGCGQTLSLMVNDLRNKVELRWLQSQENDSDKNLSASRVTLPRLLGSLRRIEQILLDSVISSDLVIKVVRLCEGLREKARKGPIYLPKTQERKQNVLFPGETITAESAFPSILQVFLSSDEKLDKLEEKGRWFEFCIESESLGPVVMSISRNNGKLSCKLQVLDNKIPNFGKYLDSLTSRFENAGYRSGVIELAGLNEHYPEILHLLDRYSEEYVNYRV